MKISVAKLRALVVEKLAKAEKEAAKVKDQLIANARKHFEREASEYERRLKDNQAWLKEVQKILASSDEKIAEAYHKLGYSRNDETEQVRALKRTLETLDLCSEDSISVREAEKVVGRIF